MWARVGNRYGGVLLVTHTSNGSWGFKHPGSVRSAAVGFVGRLAGRSVEVEAHWESKPPEAHEHLGVDDSAPVVALEEHAAEDVGSVAARHLLPQRRIIGKAIEQQGDHSA